MAGTDVEFAQLFFWGFALDVSVATLVASVLPKLQPRGNRSNGPPS